MSAAVDFLDFAAKQLADANTAWSIGTFGAIAEFTREVNEAATLARGDDAVSVVTPRGAIRIKSSTGMRPIASETPTTESWSHRVALCLSKEDCVMSRRTALIEVGPDRDALREEDSAAIVFDLGLDALQVDVCVRSNDQGVISELRRYVGKSLFASDSRAMAVILASSPHRVFASRLGRIEVYQPIPPADGKSPEGPHTHVLPRLLAHGRTHAATEPVPSGWVPCAHFYPPHPLQDRYGHRQSFQ